MKSSKQAGLLARASPANGRKFKPVFVGSSEESGCFSELVPGFGTANLHSCYAQFSVAESLGKS
jgi:hypothetical protein